VFCGSVLLPGFRAGSAKKRLNFAFLGVNSVPTLKERAWIVHDSRMRMPSQTKMKPSPVLFVSAIALLLCAAAPRTALGMASAELYSTEPHFYGRFEARIRYAPGDGVVSSFFLWKEGSSDAGAYWNELDMEKVGANCEMHTNAYYGQPAVQHTQVNSMSSDICADYHTYALEWTSTYISWSIDGKEFRKETGETATAFAENASGGMTMHFNIWPGNADFGGDISKTTLPVRQYISWVQYSSYDNGTFTVKSREDFDGSSVPSGWAVGNWGSPFNLSTHNPKNVGFVNGIAVMSLTSDDATGNPGTPPVDTAAGGASGTGGSPSSGGSSGSGTGGASGGAGGSSGSGTGGASGGAGGSSGSGTGGASGGVGGAVGSGGATPLGGAGSSGSGGKGAAGGSVGAGGSASSGGAVAHGGATASGNGGAAGKAVGGSSSAGGSNLSGSGGSSASGSGGTMAPVASTGGASGTGSSTQTNSSSGCSMAGGHHGAATALVGLILGVLVTWRRKRTVGR
jgi:hypothetical protein